MIALTAYGVRKGREAYKKRKAAKELSQRGSQPDLIDPSAELKSVSSSASSTLAKGDSQRCGSALVPRAESTGSGPRSSYEQSQNAILSPSTRSAYTASDYSQSSQTSPADDIRQYQQYVERQSHGYMENLDEPPSYEDVVAHQPLAPRMNHRAQSGYMQNSYQPQYRQQQRPFSTYTTPALSQLMYTDRSPQAPEPMSAVSDIPDTGTYRSELLSAVSELQDTGTYQSAVSKSSSQPPLAVSELPAKVPEPLRISCTPELDTQRAELPAVVESIERAPPLESSGSRRRKRVESSSSSSGESDNESLHEKDIAKQFETS